MADDDGPLGKGAEFAQDSLRLLALLLQDRVADLVDTIAVPDRATGPQEALELRLGLPVPAEPKACNLDDLVARRVDARRLDIEDDDVFCLECL